MNLRQARKIGRRLIIPGGGFKRDPWQALTEERAAKRLAKWVRRQWRLSSERTMHEEAHYVLKLGSRAQRALRLRGHALRSGFGASLSAWRMLGVEK